VIVTNVLPCDVNAAATGVELVREGGARALDLLAQCFALFRHRIVDAVHRESLQLRAGERSLEAAALVAMAERIKRGEFDHD
jgi:hypothetical protein